MKKTLSFLAVAAIALSAMAQSTGSGAGRSAGSYSSRGYGRPSSPEANDQPGFAKKFQQQGAQDSAGEAEDAADAPAVGIPAASKSADGMLSNLVKEAAEYGVFLIRQPYLGWDGHDNYLLDGYGNDTEVGAAYSIGLNLNGGYLYTSPAVAPWEFDSKAPSLEGNTFVTTPGTTTFSMVGDKADYQPLLFSEALSGVVYPEYIYTMPMKSDLFASGFEVNRQEGKRDGFLVWAVAPAGKDLAADADITLKVEPRSFTVDKDPAKLLSLNSYNTDVLGVFFVVPEANGIGNIVLYLEGVGVCNDRGRWELAFPFGDQAELYAKEQLVKPKPKADNVPGRKIIKRKSASSAADTKADVKADVKVAPKAEEPAVKVETPEKVAPKAEAPEKGALKADAPEKDAPEKETPEKDVPAKGDEPDDNPDIFD